MKYLAAFTAAILNNQPMGFYSAAVLVKDAQRHGLRVKPIDLRVSDWPCAVEHENDGTLSLRIGLGYAKSLTKKSAEALVRGVIYDRAAQLAPPSLGVTRDGIMNGNQLMLDEWWDSLGYRNSKTWWVNWKDGLIF